jgi:hypothetical protein
VSGLWAAITDTTAVNRPKLMRVTWRPFVADCRRMSVCEPGLRSSRLMLQVGKFCVLQICYSNGSNPYLTSLAPVIPPPELSLLWKAQQSDFEWRSSTDAVAKVLFCFITSASAPEV